MEMTELGCNKRVPNHPNDDCPISSGRGEDDTTIDKVVHKLRRLFDSVILGDKVTPRSAVIETDYEQWKTSDRTDHQYLTHGNNYGSYDDLSECRLCQNISKQLTQLLSTYAKKDLNCRLLVPSDLLAKISQDVVRMSQNEPCGIRGCIIYVNMEEKSLCRKLGKLECDPSTVATFELYLTLKEDTRTWVLAKSMLGAFKGCLINGNSKTTKVLCPGFQIAKRKLYRPN